MELFSRLNQTHNHFLVPIESCHVIIRLLHNTTTKSWKFLIQNLKLFIPFMGIRIEKIAQLENKTTTIVAVICQIQFPTIIFDFFISKFQKLALQHLKNIYLLAIFPNFYQRKIKDNARQSLRRVDMLYSFESNTLISDYQ